MRCKLQGVCYIVSKRHELWSTNSFKLDCSFYPPAVNSAFHFIFKFRRRRSANWTQPNFAERWTVDRANNLPKKSWGRPSRKKWGPKTFTFVRFLTTSRLNGECLLKENNRTGALESTKGLLRCPKISWTLVHKRLKNGPDFLHTPHYFVLSQSIVHSLIGINVTPHSDCKWYGIEFVCSSDLKPKRC